MPTKNRPAPAEPPLSGPPPRTPAPLAAGEWRAAVFAAVLPRDVKIIAAAGHWAVTPEAREVLTPTVLALREAAELPHWDVLAAVGTLCRAGWITRGEDPEGRTVTASPTPGRGRVRRVRQRHRTSLHRRHDHDDQQPPRRRAQQR